MIPLDYMHIALHLQTDSLGLCDCSCILLVISQGTFRNIVMLLMIELIVHDYPIVVLTGMDKIIDSAK